MALLWCLRDAVIWCCFCMLKLIAYTDGACSGNPGPGGWGAILQALDGTHIVKERELSGGEEHTTNNRMELSAAIGVLEALERKSSITIYTDSVYLKDGIQKWLSGWKARGWKTADKKPVKNQDLWEQIDALNKKHDVTWVWVKGHAGEEGNERADALARKAIDAHKD